MALLVLVMFGVTTARVFVWPDLRPLPGHVDAIVELGGPGDRDAVTLDLAAQHLAPLVIQSTVASDALSDTCLPPVPGVEIGCFHPAPDTTRGEARWIGEQAAEHGWHSIIIVTTPDHAWRARLRVQRCFPGEVYVATSPLPPLDWFRQIPYQWGASAKALLLQRAC
ncbi:YdcF family protein [Nocardioides sp. MAH-18]|uniref:YdcF family protein n=1 Tax=Nocardioides agri TaxID=2682843 RepID=A0A6L6XTW1_9ACTN|nr:MULTISPECIES: YdcF family protein [unclassified Nocardioides]MBA2954224.1 YdcF family protein [Nocardioides sp. CGMCC 1.13656]MVQ49085.1 YdcF family protein [Nocardioides sp. MAH-18]